MSIGSHAIEVSKFKSETERDPQREFTNVYVKYIPRYCDEAMCRAAFTKIVSDALKDLQNENSNDSNSNGNSDGSVKSGDEAEITSCKFWVQKYGVSGCFNFATFKQAQIAVSQLNGFDLTKIYPPPPNPFAVPGDSNDETRVLFATRAEKRERRKARQNMQRIQRNNEKMEVERETVLYVNNLKRNVTDSKLKEMFSSFGDIISAKVRRDANGFSLKYGFVTFNTATEAKRAIDKMNGRRQVDYPPLFVSIKTNPNNNNNYCNNNPSNNPQNDTDYNPGSQRFRNDDENENQNQNGSGQLIMDRPHAAGMKLDNGNVDGGNDNNSDDDDDSNLDVSPALEGVEDKVYNAAAPGEKKQMIGNNLFWKIHAIKPKLAGKITGMLLELDNKILFHLLNDDEALESKINEALMVLEHHQVIITSQEKKKEIGNKLYSKIVNLEPILAGKITGMLLELENKYLLQLLNNDQALEVKINEAVALLQDAYHSKMNSNGSEKLWYFANDNREKCCDKLQIIFTLANVGDNISYNINEISYTSRKTQEQCIYETNDSTKKRRVIVYKAEQSDDCDGEFDRKLTKEESAVDEQKEFESKDTQIPSDDVDVKEKEKKKEKEKENNCKEQKKENAKQKKTELEEMRSMFDETMAKKQFKIKQIVKIKFDQVNEQEWNSYNQLLTSKIKKQDDNDNNNCNKNIESYLFFGSSNDKIQKIVRNGFDRYCYKSGLHGRGLYFLKNASCCHENCIADMFNEYHMLICRVIVGDYCKGTRSMYKATRKPNGGKYDCLVDHVTNPTVFVVSQDHHCIPYYVIKYEKISK